MLLGATNISSGRKRILLMIFPLPLNLNPICIYFHDFRDKIGDNYVNPLLNSKAEKSIKYSFGFAPSKWNTTIYFFLSNRHCSSSGDIKTILENILLLIFNILGYSRVFVNSLIAQHQYFYHVELSNHNRKYKIPSTFSQILFFAGVLASGTGKPQNTASQVRLLFVSGEIR